MTDLETLLEPLVEHPAHEPLPIGALRGRVQRRTRRRRVALALGVVLAFALPMVVVAATDDTGATKVDAPFATTPSEGDPVAAVDGLPATFDPTTAEPVFVADGSAAEVATAYLSARLPDLQVTVQPVDVGRSGAPTIRWATPQDAGSYNGTLLLKALSGPDGWSIVAATTDGIDASEVGTVPGVLAGTVRSSALDLLSVDVVDADDVPIDGSGPAAGEEPEPWGTAGTSDAGGVRLGLPLSGPAFVRIRLVGGTFLAITEFAVTGAPGEDTADATTTTETTTSTTAVPPSDVAAPWSAAPLPTAAATATVEAWQSDGSPGAECPALAPADLGEGEGATPRATTRGQPGAWWVAYDLPGAPGEAEIQSPSRDAGKETFSVSAIELDTGSADRFPHKLRWADGSHGSYGAEGDGTLPMPDGVPYPWLAYINMSGSPCLYQVHTYLGRDHLEHLIRELRLVEGTP
jgi:hypothetical protein